MTTKRAFLPLAKHLLGNLLILSMGVMVGSCSTAAQPKPFVAVSPSAKAANASPAPTAGAKETGKASWYGAKFQGKPTASGEKFDRNAFTAAHPKLPFGTKVRVINPENGKSVVVRVNDRFPATAGRAIDLSEAAFKTIAPLERGVLTVELEPLGK